MLKKNQKGVIDPVFIIVLVLVLVVGGFIYWRTSQKEETPRSQSSSQSQDSEELTEGEQNESNDEVANWTEYSDSTLSFKYPKEWTEVNCDIDKSRVYIGASKENVGINSGSSTSILCGGGTDFPAQGTFTLTNESQIQNDPDVTAVKFAGQDGNKLIIVEDGSGLREKGHKTVIYEAKVDGQYLTAIYNVFPAGTGGYDTSPANEQIFDTIVIKTLQLK